MLVCKFGSLRKVWGLNCTSDTYSFSQLCVSRYNYKLKCYLFVQSTHILIKCTHQLAEDSAASPRDNRYLTCKGVTVRCTQKPALKTGGGGEGELLGFLSFYFPLVFFLLQAALYSLSEDGRSQWWEKVMVQLMAGLVSLFKAKADLSHTPTLNVIVHNTCFYPWLVDIGYCTLYASRFCLYGQQCTRSPSLSMSFCGHRYKIFPWKMSRMEAVLPSTDVTTKW